MRYSGGLEFRAKDFGIEFDPVDVVVGTGVVERVSVFVKDESLVFLCSVDFDGFDNIKNVIIECVGACKLIAGRVSCFFCESVNPLVFEIGNLIDENGQPVVYEPKKIIFRDVPGWYRLLSTVNHKILVNFLNRSDESTNYYVDLFSGVLALDDIARFLFLYNMLLQFVGDRQESVDREIKKVYPDVPMNSVKRNGKIIEETVYTRLRNEVGHKRSGTSFMQTRGGIRANVNKLQDIVKMIIFKLK